MDMAGNVNDLSKSYDVSVAKIIQFQNAMIMAGGKAEDANKILGTMFSKISDAQSGNDAAIAAFEELGISFKELQTTAPDQMIKKVYDGLASIGNSYDRIKAVKEILGKGGLGTSLKEIGDALGENTVLFEKQAQALEKWDAMADAVDAALINLKMAFAELFAPFTQYKVITVNEFKAAIVALGSVAAVSGVMKLVGAVGQLVKVLREGAALTAALEASSIIGLVGVGAGVAAYMGAKAYFEKQDEEALANAPEGDEGTSTPSQAGGRTGGREAAGQRAKIALARTLLEIESRRALLQIEGIRGNQYEQQFAESRLKYEEDIAKATQERADALRKDKLTGEQISLIEQDFQLKKDKAEQDDVARRAIANQQRQYALELSQLALDADKERHNLDVQGLMLEQDKGNMSDWEYQRAVERLNLEKRLQALYQERVALEKRTDKDSPEWKAEQQRIATAIKGEQELSEIRQQGIDADQYRAESWAAGWDGAFKKFVQDSKNYGAAGAEAFQSVVGNMNSAIDNFVKTGKFAFKDFAISVIRDLIAIQMKMQAMKLFEYGMKAMGFSVPGKAVGGMVQGGTPYMVGENGPELFVPQQGGSIVPNQRLGSTIGQTPQVVYNGPFIQNMSAIDTQSATQFLVSNRQAVWAANQSAQRGLPLSK